MHKFHNIGNSTVQNEIVGGKVRVAKQKHQEKAVSGRHQLYMSFIVADSQDQVRSA